MSNTTSTLKNEMNSSATKAQKAIKSTSEDFGSQVSGQIDTLMTKAQDVVKQYEPEVKAAARSTVDFVKRNPVACLLGAAAVGYALIAFARRNRE